MLRNFRTLGVTAALAAALLAWTAPAQADDCTGKETLKASCKLKGEVNKVQVQLKKAVKRADVTIRFDGDPNTDVVVTTSNGGKAKIKVEGLAAGDHTVEVISGETSCVSAEFTCE